jgi:hypothetical protein
MSKYTEEQDEERYFANPYFNNVHKQAEQEILTEELISKLSSTRNTLLDLVLEANSKYGLPRRCKLEIFDIDTVLERIIQYILDLLVWPLCA